MSRHTDFENCNDGEDWGEDAWGTDTYDEQRQPIGRSTTPQIQISITDSPVKMKQENREQPPLSITGDFGRSSEKDIRSEENVINERGPVVPQQQTQTPNPASIPNFRRKKNVPSGQGGKKGLKLPLQINLPKPSSALTASGTYHTPSIEIKATGITQLLDFSKLDTSSGVLGRGVSSVVLRGVYKDETSEFHNQKFAVKVVELKSMNNSVIENEIHSIMNLKSDYIVTLYDAYSKEGCINMVLEYMELGSLEDICATLPDKKIPNEVVREIAGQLTRGLAHLEKNGIIHRDLKPANCLMNKKGVCKLGDFGFSKKRGEGMDYFQTYQGSITYMSPERIQGNKHSFNADVWSLGVTILECILGRYPFHDKDSKNEMLNMWQAQQLIEEGLHIDSLEVQPELEDFVKKCTIPDPEQRPLASQLLNHPYLVHDSTAATRRWIKTVYLDAKKKKQLERQGRRS